MWGSNNPISEGRQDLLERSGYVYKRFNHWSSLNPAMIYDACLWFSWAFKKWEMFVLNKLIAIF